MDPDSVKYQKYWKNLTKQEKLKNEAAECFQRAEIDAALELYRTCLGLDTLNNEYNKAILFNMACGLGKVGRCEEALGSLNRAIAMDKEYAKAYIKRGDILLQQNKYDESIAEYMKVREFAPTTPGLREKV
jgi:tetratricopeptide (TPR) repeat protein